MPRCQVPTAMGLPWVRDVSVLLSLILGGGVHGFGASQQGLDGASGKGGDTNWEEGGPGVLRNQHQYRPGCLGFMEG